MGSKIEIEPLRQKLYENSTSTHGHDLEYLFQQADMDGNGALDVAELKATVQRLVPGCLTDDQVQMLVKAADTDGDGEISCEEFVQWVSGKRDAGARAHVDDRVVCLSETPESRNTPNKCECITITFGC